MDQGSKSYKTKTISAETIERISYERAKQWGKLFNRYLTVEDTVEINMLDEDSLAEVLGEDDEELMVCFDEAEEHDESISDGGRGQSDAEESDDAAIQDMLDQTRPVLIEHERKWRKAGIDRVLNTFDPQKIEKEVGGWLRCNRIERTREIESSSDSETDSLQLNDLARYIMTSRKQCSDAHQRHANSCPSSSMNIKTYRTLQKKREALHEKYAYLTEEKQSTYNHHDHDYLPRHKYTPKNDFWQSRYHHNEQPQNIIDPVAEDIGQRRGRKVLLKSRSSSTLSLSSDSISDRNYPRHAEKKLFRRKSMQKRNQKMYDCYHRHFRELHFRTQSERKLIKKHDCSANKFDKCTLDVCCRREGKLCGIKRKFVKPSFEEWVMESCDSPKRNAAPKHIRIENSLSDEEGLPESSDISASCFNDLNIDVKLSKEAYKKECGEKLFSARTTGNKRTNTKIKRSLRNANSKPDASIPFQILLENNEQMKMKNEKSAKYKEPEQLAKKTCSKNFPPKLARKEESLGREKEEIRNRYLSATNLNDLNELKTEIKCTNTKVTQLIRNANTKPDSPNLFQTLSKNNNQMKKISEISSNNNESEVLAKNSNSQIRSKSTALKHVQKGDSLSDEEGETESSDISATYLDDLKRAIKLSLETYKKECDGTSTIAYINRTQRNTESTFFSSSANIYNSTTLPIAAARANQIHNPLNQTANDTVVVAVSTPKSPSSDCAIVPLTTTELSQQEQQPSIRTKLQLQIQIQRCHQNHKQLYPSQPLQDFSKQVEQMHQDPKGILLYSPHNPSMSLAHSLSNGEINITEKHLSAVIGEKAAQNFFKYYIGPRCFDSTSTIYFRPPQSWNLDIDSGSDDDVLEFVGQYGELYQSTK